MKLRRIVDHLLTTRARVRRAFPRSALRAIEDEIGASEPTHFGDIQFAVEGALDGAPLFNGQSARERALEVFSLRRVWDTEHNSGLLIYVLLADRAVEIVADRGIHARVDTREWEKVCRQMEAAFKQGDYEGGAIGGIRAVTRHLVAHFPADRKAANELSNEPVLL